MKKKTIKAYRDGDLLCCDVVQAALDNNLSVSELKLLLIAENPGAEITFKVK